MYEIIKKKRDGGKLSDAEIRYFIEGYSKGSIPDYQASALCMAIYYKGMDLDETTSLTLAVRDSGEKLRFGNIDGVRVDKHSTGGVGDKTSLVVAPICAALGIKLAKMSGRGLGHTGGTIDKLESIKGFRASLDPDEFEEIVNRTGIAIAGQSSTLAPADKKLYALRDVTATIDSMPLIASSVMGKKLAADDDCIVLDVKTGSGAFMKTFDDARELARLMCGIGRKAGKKMTALITDMDQPLGYAVGNSLEVMEAIDTLHGRGPEDFTELCLVLASNMLSLAGKGSTDECYSLAKSAIDDRSALNKFIEMVSAQGGDESWIRDTSKFPRAKYNKKVYAEKSGYIYRINAEEYGTVSLMVGAGRNTMADVIDPTAGVVLSKKRGDYVNVGDLIATVYTTDKFDTLDVATSRIIAATEIRDERPEKIPVVLGKVE